MSSSAKVALVTGSTSGIGLAISRALASKGVNVVITGFGDEATISEIVDDIKTRFGVKVIYIAADLAKVSDIDSLWSKVTENYPDGIDILINNAGFVCGGFTENVSDDDWNKTIAVMLTAPFQLTKRCLPLMKKKGYGRIVNISSIFGLVGEQLISPYVTVKHGIIGLTKGVALETAQHGITCNAVCPGYTNTQLVEGSYEAGAKLLGITIEDLRKRQISSIPTGRFNATEQVAELVEFLCLSNASSQMTGAAYPIDQGFTAQ